MRLALAVALAATPLTAQEADLSGIVAGHILPRYETLAAESAALAAAAEADCSPESADLRAAYGSAFDAWVAVSHLRFGPSETEERAFELAFWPDPRGTTPKSLATLIRDADPVVEDADAFGTVSVAARGFYAMEFLLYDAQFLAVEETAYRCALIEAVARDIAGNAEAILTDWEGGYADLLTIPGNDTYRTEAEAARQLFTALSTGLEFTVTQRLGRPLGTFDRPRPARAEARRSGRSLRHVVLSIDTLADLAARLSDNDPEIADAFAEARAAAERVEDPTFASVSEVQGRLRVEALQQRLDTARKLAALRIGEALGVEAGFNSLDGD
ncbi:MAG: imelysin family protein [Pseudomonadota bacterium]